MRADFYHLTRLPLERVLPAICERIHAQGQRLVIVADDDDLLNRIDQLLWSYKAESFLPHGRADGGEGDARQPILLAASGEIVGDARNIALVDGVWRDLALGYDRAFLMFDESNIAGARAAWRGLADKVDVERHYWKQDDAGKWREGP